MTDIGYYAIRLYGGSSGAGEPGYAGVRAEIRLYASDWSNHIQTILFFEGPMPPGTDGRDAAMRMPFTAFEGVVDVLRNEKPVSAAYNPINGWMLFTGKEPVGEGER